MFNSRKSRLSEVLIILVIGAFVSFINTLWLRNEIEKIVSEKVD